MPDERVRIFLQGACPTATFFTVANPDFIDRSSGNYHLSAVSPAIDRCANVNSNLGLDIDLEPLGWDDPNQINGAGAYDAGADETYLNDIIFKDGYEG
ncbi:MAG: hypothetical protein R3E90_13460 [Marinicella sp.]